MRYFLDTKGAEFALEVWGGGTAYGLTHIPNGLGVYVAGDDATIFRTELEAAQVAFPDKSDEEICRWLWDQMEYGTVAQPLDPADLARATP